MIQALSVVFQPMPKKETIAIKNVPLIKPSGRRAVMIKPDVAMTAHKLKERTVFKRDPRDVKFY